MAELVVKKYMDSDLPNSENKTKLLQQKAEKLKERAAILKRKKGFESPEIFGDCSEALRYMFAGHPRTMSINVPDIAPEEIKGLCMASAGPRGYDDLAHEKSDEHGEYFEYAGTPTVYTKDFIFEGAPIPEDCDVMLMQEGYATLSILGYDLTDYKITKQWNM